MQGVCSCCQKTYQGETPAEVGRRGFGIRVHGSITLLTSKFKLSKRRALELLKDFFQIPMHVGSVSNIEHRVSQSLESLHQQIKNKIDESKVALYLLNIIGYSDKHINSAAAAASFLRTAPAATSWAAVWGLAPT